MSFARLGLLAAVLPALALAGCGLPTTGPRGEAIEQQAPAARADLGAKLPYCLVPSTPEVVGIAQAHQPRLTGALTGARNRDYRVRIGVGDVLNITIFEAAGGGLFFPAEGGLRQGNYIVLPNQVVDDSGSITIPYAGTLKAAGLTVRQIQTGIVDKLKDRALEPQVIVTIVDQRASMVSVLGDVNHTTRYPASGTPEKVLDAVARAGGPRSPGHETWVLLERRGRIDVAPFEALVYEPQNNVVVYPADTIYLFREPQTFTAMGATTRQGQFPFESWRLNLVEALGKAGGLVDIQAEPRWVFLYRAEQRKVAEKLDPKCGQLMDAPYIPVIYEFNLREPQGYFLASRFPMRNKDVVFVANARSVESTKFMTYIRNINGTVQDPLQTAIAAYTLRNLANGASAVPIVTVGGP
jgi:polysaccharide export outer membrane protein